VRYVIDACNLIFASTPLEEALDRRGFQAARALLVGLLGRFARDNHIEQIVAVFDGSEKGAHRPRREVEELGKVVLIYSNPRSNADRAIIDMIENAERPGEITVVTDDKFIIRHVRGPGAHHLGSRAFLRVAQRARHRAADPLHGEDPRKYAVTMTSNELDDWMAYFGLKDEK
jgi:predicted RNA-binding protein with PIN domain